MAEALPGLWSWNWSRKMNKNIVYFTLTELLVTVTLICLTAGILLPALATGISRAKLTGCGNNLRAVGQCVIFYCADNSGFIPNIAPGMETSSIPILRMPNNMVLALGRLMNVYLQDARIFGCPDSPGYTGEDVANYWHDQTMAWTAYLYRSQNNEFSSLLNAPENISKPYIMDFACITNQGEQFAPHNYLASNLLFADCHLEIRRNSREPFKHYTAQASRHGEITPDCTRLWQNADE